MNKQNQALLAVFFTILLTNCGGGGSDNGSPGDPGSDFNPVLFPDNLDQATLLFEPVAIEIDEAGNRAFILEKDNSSIIAIDLDSGDRNVISASNKGSGPLPRQMLDMAMDLPNDRIFVNDLSSVIYEIDPINGNRSVFLDSWAKGIHTDVSVDIDVAGNQLVAVGYDQVNLIDLDTKEITALISGSVINFKHAILDVSGERLILQSYYNGEYIEFVDLATGARTVFYENANFRHIEDITLDVANNLIYVWSESGFYTLDLNTGGRTDLSLGSDRYSMTDPGPLGFDRQNNRLLIADRGLGNLFAFDLGSRVLEYFASSNIGTGYRIEGPDALVYDEVGDRLFVVEDYSERIYAVDPATGNRTLFSSRPVGSDVSIDDVRDMDMDYANNRILLVDYEYGLVEINLTTGDRDYFNSSHPNEITSLELDVTGNRLLLSESNGYGIYQADLSSREFSIFSTHAVSGYQESRFLAINEQASELAVVMDSNSRIYNLGTASYQNVSYNGIDDFDVSVEIDSSSATLYSLKDDKLNSYPYLGGDPTEVSGINYGSGPIFINAKDMTLDLKNHRAFIIDSAMDAIFSVDLLTGERRVISK